MNNPECLLMTMDLHLLSIIVRKYYVFYKFNMSSDVFKVIQIRLAA